MNTEYYTLAEMSRKLGKPVGTVSGWIKRYKPFIKITHNEDKKLYDNSAFEVLSIIRDMSEQKKNTKTITNSLSTKLPPLIPVPPGINSTQSLSTILDSLSELERIEFELRTKKDEIDRRLEAISNYRIQATNLIQLHSEIFIPNADLIFTEQVPE